MGGTVYGIAELWFLKSRFGYKYLKVISRKTVYAKSTLSNY